MISVSTRGFTATLAIGVTEPRASIRTGTIFFSASATSTGTAWGAFDRGAWATAPLPQKPTRMAMAMHAAAITAAAPNKMVRFLMDTAGRRAHQPPRTPLKPFAPIRV